MNLLKSRRDGPEGYREGHQIVQAEFARRRELDEVRAQQPGPGLTSAETEELAKARMAAATAARVDRKRQIEDLRDFRDQVAQVLGQAESDRSSAIHQLDCPAATEAAHRAAGLGALIDAINETGRRSFGGQWS